MILNAEDFIKKAEMDNKNIIISGKATLEAIRKKSKKSFKLAREYLGVDFTGLAVRKGFPLLSKFNIV